MALRMSKLKVHFEPRTDDLSTPCGEISGMKMLHLALQAHLANELRH